MDDLLRFMADVPKGNETWNSEGVSTKNKQTEKTGHLGAWDLRDCKNEGKACCDTYK